MVSKIIEIAIGILAVLILAIVLIYVAATTGAQAPVEMREFMPACGQWLMRGCTQDTSVLAELDDALVKENKTSLTALCGKLFPMVPPERNVTRCADVCKNKCYPNVWMDVAVVNIMFVAGTLHESKSIEMQNKGAATLWDVNASVYKLDDPTKIVQGTATFENLPSDVSVTCNSNYCTCVIDRFDSQSSIKMICETKELRVLACIDPGSVADPREGKGAVEETDEKNNCARLEG